ncbi:MAG: FtsB family cell division protein [Myxococcota bacterium]
MRAWLLVPLLGVAALGIAAFDGESGLRTWWMLRDDLRSSRETLDRLEAENERLREEAHALETDPFALERAIREDLGWARPGEVVVLFEEPGASGPLESGRRESGRGESGRGESGRGESGRGEPGSGESGP